MSRLRGALGPLLRSAPVRVVAGLLFLAVAIVLRDIVLALLRAVMGLREVPAVWLGAGSAVPPSGPRAVYAVLAAAVTIGLGYGAYRLFTRLLERRRSEELAGGRAAVGELAVGAAVGLGLIAVPVGVLWAAGSYRVAGTSGLLLVLVPAAAAATAAFMEELVFRGLLLRIVEERWGSWLALGLTSLLFGLVHTANPGATAWSAANVVLTAGVVLGGAFLATRRLWLPIGIHFAVNVAQGGLFGLPVSGKARQGILDAELAGRELLTGGDFGLEASILLLPPALLVGAWLLRRAHRRARLRPPFWIRRRQPAPAAGDSQR